ncbi:MAG: hypothetical protein GWN93_06730 [Deltaproteobacteria bacterium]|nr:hypothetical protein [Deltaproteobacteria bacterium]
MTDSELLLKLRAIDRARERIQDLIDMIEHSDHPNKSKVVFNLRNNHFDNPAWAEHCFVPSNPGWELKNCRYTWKL